MYYPYVKSKTFLSPTELAFYKKLKIIAEEKNLTVFAKVRLADLVWIPESYKYFNLFFKRIKAKQIDFVLCEKETLEIKCLIELDDKSHDLPKRQSRDKFVNKLIEKTGHSFIRCREPEHTCDIL